MKKILGVILLALLLATTVNAGVLGKYAHRVDVTARLGQNWSTCVLDHLDNAVPATFVAGKLNYPLAKNIEISGELKKYISNDYRRDWETELALEIKF